MLTSEVSSEEAPPIIDKKKDFWTIFVPNPKDECNETDLLLANDYFLFFIKPSEELINYFNNTKDKNNKRMFHLLINNKIETMEYRYIGAYYQMTTRQAPACRCRWEQSDMTQIFKNLFNKIRQTDIKFNNSKHVNLTNKIMRKYAALMFEHANKYRNKIVITI